jgi:predicted Zn-dependent protease
VTENPEDFHAQYRLGVIQVEADPAQARGTLEKAAALAPEHPGPRVFLGFALLQDREFAASQREMIRGYELSRGRTGYSLRDTSRTTALALTRIELGQPLDALPMLKDEAAKAEDNPVLWQLAADAALRGGNGEAALEHAKRAVSLEPKSGPARATLAGALFILGRNDEAQVEVDKALALHPQLPLALYVSGRLLMAQSEYTTAFNTIWTAILEDPVRADFYHEMGTQMIKLGLADQGTPVLQYMDWVTAFLGRYLGRPGRSPVN